MFDDASFVLYYWPGLPGRGEFVRLLFEEAGVDYVDVARDPDGEDAAVAAMMRVMQGEKAGALPFAPPFVNVGDLWVSQTANILMFFAPRLGLAPEDEATRVEVAQIQLTIADFVAEIHDVHHPIAGSLYYEEQRAEAERKAKHVIAERLPKYLGWLERILERNTASEGAWLVGASRTYVDLSAFQVVAGLRYAFPTAMARIEPHLPRLGALHDRVAALPRIAAYLASDRRQAFNLDGIFRHYPELDVPDALGG